jgi:DNA-directed RNA polymerase specialized sigma24 family protein
MAPDPLDALRLTLMQEVLPVGMAVVERARRGGPMDVVEAFTGSGDPLSQLREEGEPAARQVRDSLDRLQPGLGNPVLKVEVRDVPAEDPAAEAPVDPAEDRRELQLALARITERLALLEQRLEAGG